MSVPLNFVVNTIVILRNLMEQTLCLCFDRLLLLDLSIRDLPRFFDLVGHQTTNASIEYKHFFTK